MLKKHTASEDKETVNAHFWCLFIDSVARYTTTSIRTANQIGAFWHMLQTPAHRSGSVDVMTQPQVPLERKTFVTMLNLHHFCLIIHLCVCIWHEHALICSYHFTNTSLCYLFSFLKGYCCCYGSLNTHFLICICICLDFILQIILCHISLVKVAQLSQWHLQMQRTLGTDTHKQYF